MYARDILVSAYMQRGSTLFLRVSVALIALIVVVLCIFVLPQGINNLHASGYALILLGMYIPAVPFFIAIAEAWKLLDYIDANTAFSEQSVKSLGIIKYCSFVVSGFFLLETPYIFIVADRDDAPGLIVIGLFFVFIPLIVATLAAVSQRILGDAIALKSENDLTV